MKVPAPAQRYVKCYWNLANSDKLQIMQATGFVACVLNVAHSSRPATRISSTACTCCSTGRQRDTLELQPLFLLVFGVDGPVGSLVVRFCLGQLLLRTFQFHTRLQPANAWALQHFTIDTQYETKASAAGAEQPLTTTRRAMRRIGVA